MTPTPQVETMDTVEKKSAACVALMATILPKLIEDLSMPTTTRVQIASLLYCINKMFENGKFPTPEELLSWSRGISLGMALDRLPPASITTQ